MAEALQIGLFRTIDIQMVRIGGGDDAHPRAQPMETAVKLISLDHHVIRIGEDIVRAVVLRDAAEEGVTV